MNATLVLKDAGTAGSGTIWLGDGTLAVDSDEDRAIANRITGVGTIRVMGRGRFSFPELASQDGAGFTLDLGSRRGATIDTLDGFSSVTTSAASSDIYVTDMPEGSYSGTVAPNVRLHYGERPVSGMTIIVM